MAKESPNLLGKYAEFIIKNRIAILIGELVIILSLIIIFLPRIRQDVSFVSIFGEDSAIKRTSNLFKEKYGRDEMTIIGIESDQIFTIPFLKKLQSLHTELRNCSDKIVDVTSLVNARLTEGIDDQIVVHDLMEDFPETEDDLLNLKALVLANKAYRNTLINEKGNFTTIVIETGLISDIENIEIVSAIEKVAEKYHSEEFPIYLSGSPAIMKVLDSVLAKDFGKFVGLTLLTIGIILFLLFKKPSIVISPFITIFTTLLLVLSLQAMFKAPISTVTNALIPFLIAVGIGDSIHIITTFVSLWRVEDTKPALISTVKKCAVPCFYTSITTAAGLFSFINKDIVTIRDLGIYGGVGAIIAYLLTMTLVVMGLSFLKKAKTSGTKTKKAFWSLLEEKIELLGLFGFRNYIWVMLCVAITSVLIGFYIFKVKIAHDPLTWLAQKEPVVTATKKLDHYLHGSVGLELMINTDQENKFKEPMVLKKIEALETRAKNFQKDGSSFVSSVTSIVTMVKEVNKAVNEGKEEFYTIPAEKNMIAQELLLFELGGGSKTLFDYVSEDYSDIRMTFRAPWIDTVGYQGFLKFITQEAQVLFADDPNIKKENIVLCGNMAVFSEAIQAMLPLSIQGFGIAFIVITIFMMVLFKDIRLGLLSMIPNLYPIGLALGVMGAFKINLDMFNLFVGSLALGIVVDDTVHIIHHFKSNMSLYNGDIEMSIKETMSQTGRALVFTTVILCLGFFSYLFSSMGNIYSFGVLLIITLFTALLADLVVTPALLTLYYKKRKLSMEISKSLDKL